MIYSDQKYIYIPMEVFAASAEHKSYSAKAAYIDLILMGNDNCGTIETSVEELSQRWAWGHNRVEAFVTRLARRGYCDVVLCNGDVTIVLKGQPQCIV